MAQHPLGRCMGNVQIDLFPNPRAAHAPRHALYFSAGPIESDLSAVFEVCWNRPRGNVPVGSRLLCSHEKQQEAAAAKNVLTWPTHYHPPNTEAWEWHMDGIMGFLSVLGSALRRA